MFGQKKQIPWGVKKRQEKGVTQRVPEKSKNTFFTRGGGRGKEGEKKGREVLQEKWNSK